MATHREALKPVLGPSPQGSQCPPAGAGRDFCSAPAVQPCPVWTLQDVKDPIKKEWDIGGAPKNPLVVGGRAKLSIFLCPLEKHHKAWHKGNRKLAHTPRKNLSLRL